MHRDDAIATEYAYCFRIAGGRIAELPIATVTLPPDSHTRLAAAYVSDQTLEMLPEFASLAQRLVPWCAVYLAPRLVADDWHSLYGRAWADRELAAIALSGRRLDEVVSTICHEAMHLCWPWLTDRARGTVAAEVAQGVPWPGSYLDDIEERAARAFQHYALARIEGMGFTALTDVEAAIHVFEAILSGAHGRAVMDAQRRRSAAARPKAVTQPPR